MYEYEARLDRVVDGDTVDAMIDLGMTVWIKKRIRFHGVDTWESRTRNKGLLAKARTKELLNKNDGKFVLQSMGLGKYGRVLGILKVDGHNRTVNQILIDEGHAYTYHGEKKKSFK